MNFRSFTRVLLVIIIFMVFQSCSTLPKLANVSPENYENEFIKIEYYIGLNVYYIIIDNKTENPMTIDFNRASIVSIDNESRNLNLKSKDGHIPPLSKVIYQSNNEAFFVTDVNTYFYNKNSKFIFNSSSGYTTISDSDIIKSMIGKNVRLYLPIIINGQEQIFDIRIRIVSVRE